MNASFAPRPLAVLAGALLMSQGCSPLLLPEDPPRDPRAVATALWEEVDAYYPWFELKAVDWQVIRATTVAGIDAVTPERELFHRLADMLEVLRDGHLALTSPFGRRSWQGWHQGHPANFDADVARSYLAPPNGSAGGGNVTWGHLTETIGYVRIASFGESGVGEGVGEALRSLAPLGGLVIDIRDNGGGSDVHSEAAAGRFTDRRIHYRTVRYKSGPSHEDFGPEVESFVEPTGGTRFHGPVVLLQNRRVFSAAEDFVLAMREMPQVTAVGDTTGGGSGNPIGRELPNGWVASVPRWRQWTAAGEVYEGVGLAPDETLAAPANELAQGRDAILERAMEILGGG